MSKNCPMPGQRQLSGPSFLRYLTPADLALVGQLGLNMQKDTLVLLYTHKGILKFNIILRSRKTCNKSKINKND
jgi:hypothetical protein